MIERAADQGASRIDGFTSCKAPTRRARRYRLWRRSRRSTWSHQRRCRGRAPGASGLRVDDEGEEGRVSYRLSRCHESSCWARRRGTDWTRLGA